MAELRFAEPGDRKSVEDGDLFMPAFDANGLIACVTCDHRSRAVLMVAYMNEEALAATIRTGEAHYWSRSRGELWHKGATSGSIQKVVEIRTDCDQDTVLLMVDVVDDRTTCHTGRASCFYRHVVLPPEGGDVKLAHIETE